MQIVGYMLFMFAFRKARTVIECSRWEASLLEFHCWIHSYMTWGILQLIAAKTASHMKSHASKCDNRWYLSKVTTMLKGKQLCSRAKSIRLYNYIAWLERRQGDRGPLKRMSEATGQWLWWIETLALQTSVVVNFCVNEVKKRHKIEGCGSKIIGPVTWTITKNFTTEQVLTTIV